MRQRQNLHLQLVYLRCDAADWVDGLPVAGFFPTAGLCLNLRLDHESRAELTDLLIRWPGGTGDGLYPVPHPQVSAKQAFEKSSAREFWNPEFEYARNRWALLDWLIEQTQHQPEESQP